MHLTTSLKRRLALFCVLAAALLLLLAGCGSREISTSPEKKSANATLPVKNTGSDNTKTEKNTKPDKEQVEPVVDSGPKLELSLKGITLNWVDKGVIRM